MTGTTSAFPKFVQSSNMMRSSSNHKNASKYTGAGSSRMGGGVTSSITGGQNKSSMLEQEMRAIRKIKEKQRKEIEQMIDYELKMNQIKAKNEANMKLQQEKEARHEAELERRRKE